MYNIYCHIYSAIRRNFLSIPLVTYLVKNVNLGKENWKFLNFENLKSLKMHFPRCFPLFSGMERETKKSKMFNNNSLESFALSSQLLLRNLCIYVYICNMKKSLPLIFITYFVKCKHDNFDRHFFLTTINLDI